MSEHPSGAPTAIVPNLFVVGAQKAGTTTLWEYLDRHPDVYMCQPKEPNHFTIGRYDRKDYLALFTPGADARYRGDATTANSLTSLYPDVPAAIAAMSPQARIVYVLRDPIRRLESSWVQGRSQLNEKVGPFDDALRDEPRFLDASRYWTNLQAYRRVFPDSSILVLFFEDLKLDPAGMSASLWDFLGLTPLPHHVGVIQANPSQGKTRVTFIGRWVQDSGLADLARKVVPQGPRRTVRRLISRRIEPASWRRSTLEWARHELEPEARAVLEFCGRPPDFWSLEPSWDVTA